MTWRDRSGRAVERTYPDAIVTLADGRPAYERDEVAMPHRVQLRRTKGWRMPPNTVSVARPTKFGNPFKIGAIVHFGLAFSGRDETVEDAKHACHLFRRWLLNLRSAEHIALPLRGKNLACWCPLCAAHTDGKPFGVECADCSPCHADVLLELANRPKSTPNLLPPKDVR